MKVIATLLLFLTIQNSQCGNLFDNKEPIELEDINGSDKPANLLIPFTLNIAKPGKVLVDVTEKRVNGVTQKKYTSKKCFGITAISDGSNNLWEAQGDESALMIGTFTRNNGTCLIVVQTIDGGEYFFHYYEWDGDLWRSIEEEAFFEKTRDMEDEWPSECGSNGHPDHHGDSMDERSEPTNGTEMDGESMERPNKVTLDVSIIPGSEVPSVKPQINRPFLIVEPLPGNIITMVMDGKCPIWVAKEGQMCLSATFVMRGTTPMLAQLVIKRMGEEDAKTLYFEKKLLEWSVITKRSYRIKAKKLRAHEDDGFLTNSLYIILLAAIYSMFDL